VLAITLARLPENTAVCDSMISSPRALRYL
jgi:hypothetical protein